MKKVVLTIFLFSAIANAADLKITYISNPPGATGTDSFGRKSLLPSTFTFALPKKWKDCVTVSSVTIRWVSGAVLTTDPLKFCPNDAKTRTIYVDRPTGFVGLDSDLAYAAQLQQAEIARRQLALDILNSQSQAQRTPSLTSGRTTAPATTALLLFGGSKREFLGCLNCSEYDSDSVLNKYGKGSPYDSKSIWNHYGDYGSKYSSTGACNPYATDPPLIVDKDGKFYGRLTMNKYHAQLGVGASWMAWLGSVCE